MMNKKIGILGGGQLGKMLIQAGSKWGLDMTILDKSRNFPAGKICPQFVEGDFKNSEDVVAFGKDMDIVTIEIENVNTDALYELEKMGKKVFPQAHIIELIKDKGEQKIFYSKNSIPTCSYRIYQNREEVLTAIANGKHSFPFIQKSCTGGYDGKGVQMIANESELNDLFEGRTVVEKLVDLAKELSVIVARNIEGEIKVFDPVEMVFNHEANLLEKQIAPANIDSDLAKQAISLATDVAQKLGIVGVLAVEMFLDKNGQLLVNEVAPRPHNSGHHTIESANCSQFEQHLRCITGMPLADTSLISPSVLLNLVGEKNHTGTPYYQGLDTILELAHVHVHIYGKELTKPFRKMGHITILNQDQKVANENAKFIKETLKVISQ